MSALARGRGKAWIRTASGGKFWPLAPRATDVEIEDVAHALSHLCRFTGHVKEFYSVATHCLCVSRWVEQEARARGATKREAAKLALEGLLHDATEAYLADLSTPVKRQDALAGYRAAEERVRLAIARRFGLPKKESPIVKEGDRALLLAEARDLLPCGTEGFEGVEGRPAQFRIPGGEFPARVRRDYLERFKELRRRAR